MANQYFGAGNPYLNQNNPYVVQEDPTRKKAAGSALTSAAMLLAQMKRGQGKSITKPQSPSVTEPTVDVNPNANLSAFDQTGWESTIAADDMAVTKPVGTEGLDAFNFEASPGVDAAYETGGSLSSAYEMGGAGGGFTEGAGGAAAGGEAGGSAASSGGGASLGVILALIKAGMMNKNKAAENIENNRNDTTTFERYYNRASQTPVNSVLTPGQAFVDLELIGPDTAVGKVVGLPGKIEKGVMDKVGQYCIMVSACTGRYSYEVNVTRKFRDRFMDEELLTGYYTLCLFVVPFINKYPLVKRIVKKCLVDRLVDYGEWRLGMKPETKYTTSGVVKTVFLGLCRHIGKGVDAVLAGQEV